MTSEMMDEPEKVDQFNRALDQIVMGRVPPQAGFAPEDQRAISLAHRLSQIDPSRESFTRENLRRQIAQRASRLSRGRYYHPKLIPWAALVVIAVLIAGWAFNPMSSHPTMAAPFSATAYVLAPSAVTVNSPHAASAVQTQTMPPKPIPTPAAPVVSASYENPGSPIPVNPQPSSASHTTP